MKNILLVLIALIPSITVTAQSIKNKLGPDGNFLILDSGIEGDTEKVKLLINESGYVNWYLDKQDFYIRDGQFQPYLPDDETYYSYDFIHIDGTNGRIGFNILSPSTSGQLDSELPLTSSIHLHGSIATRVRLLDGTNNYAIQQDDHILIINKTNGGDTEMTLPLIADSHGREYIFKRDGNQDGKIVIKPSSGEKLNGVVDGEIDLNTDNSSIEVVCDKNTGWWVLSEIDAVAFTNPVTTDINIGNDEIVLIDFSLDNEVKNINLPDASVSKGDYYEIKRNYNGATFTGNIVNIIPKSGQNLDQYDSSSPYKMMNDWESVIIRCDGVKWMIVASHNH